MKIKQQTDIRDCGVNVIQALCAFFHYQWIDINELKKSAIYGTKGINANNLINLAAQYGVKLTPYNVEISDLRKSGINDHLVALIKKQNQAHYVIIKLKPKFIIVFDSSNDRSLTGKTKISYDQFQEQFMDFIFLTEKISFHHQKNHSYNVWQIIDKKMLIIFIIFSLMIVSLLLMFLSSFFLKIILDQVIPGHLKNTLLVIVISFSFIAILRVSINFVQDYLSNKILFYFEWKLYKVYWHKLSSSSSLQELNKLSTSEHLQRLNLIPQISQFITSFYQLIFQYSLLLIFSTSILLWLSLQMFAITLLFAFLIVILISFSQWRLRSTYDQAIEAQIGALNTQVDLAMSLYELKNNDFKNFLMQIMHEKNFYNKKYQYKLWKIYTMQKIVNELATLISPIVLTFIASNLIFDNQMSIGTMLFFLSIFHYFIDTLKNITNFIANFNYNYKNLNLLNFCLQLKDETKVQRPIQLQLTKIKLIVIEELVFSFDKPFFSINNLVINSNIHLNGANGSGKTTLLKLIHGLYHGDKPLLINGYPLSHYPLEIYRQKIFFANPHSYLPNLTIFEYITLNNPIATKNFLDNCKDFNLFALFNKVNLNLHLQIINNGQNLSAGQKQLVILLRLISFRYDLILNDEALENIDNATILILQKAINKFQNAIYIEISHAKKYLSSGKKVMINEIITHLN